jgi:hypothetical protein
MAIVRGVTGNTWLRAAALCACAMPLQSYAADRTWSGTSNSHGGEVSFGYFVSPSDPAFDPEMAESMPLVIRCNGFDGALTISVPWDMLTFEVGTQVHFGVDGRNFSYGAGLAFIGGDYTAIPTVELSRGDPLLEALMTGSSARVFVDEAEAEILDLNGTRQVMTQHLQNCL